MQSNKLKNSYPKMYNSLDNTQGTTSIRDQQLGHQYLTGNTRKSDSFTAPTHLPTNSNNPVELYNAPQSNENCQAVAPKANTNVNTSQVSRIIALSSNDQPIPRIQTSQDDTSPETASENVVLSSDESLAQKRAGRMKRRDTTWTNKDIPGNRITEWQAGWNVTNAIQGMFVVSLPYAVLYGGYWALLAMNLVAYICNYTGNILVDCLYEEHEEIVMQEVTNFHGRTFLQERTIIVRDRVRNSYVTIAQHVWGDRWGSILVNTAQIIELLMTCILYIVLCGDLMYGSFEPNGAFSPLAWMTFSTLLLLPCAFVKTLTGISRLSFACTVTHVIINVAVIVYCLTKIRHWFWAAVTFKMDIWNFPVSMGVIVFSYTSHIFLPALEGNLYVTETFGPMLKWSHIAAAVFKSIFGYIGFLTFGKQTQEVITNNFTNVEFKGILNIVLVAKAIFSYPLPYFAASELIETALFRGRVEGTPFPTCFDLDTGNFKVWAILLRLALILVTLAMAVLIPYFNILMGLIGSFTGTLLSFMWPCYFHIKIKGKQMSPKMYYADIAIMCFGVICGSFGIFYSFNALKNAIRTSRHHHS